MRKERKTEVFSKIKRLYSRGRHLGRVRKFEKCDEFSKEIWERDKERRSTMSGEEKRKTEGGRDRVKSRCKRVQEEWVTGKVYSKNFVWIEWQ